MMMLPAKKGTCVNCATAHESNCAHNLLSLFYQMRFQMQHGRAPTWADAVAHMNERDQQMWMKAMKRMNVLWSEPPADVAVIAEPYAISE